VSRNGIIGALLFSAVLAGCGEGHRARWPEGIRRSEGKGSATNEEGLWTYWYPDGQLRERGEYKGGHKVGVWTQWYRGGQRASSGERVWVPDRRASERHGMWTTWHENGQKRSAGTYDRGSREGHRDAWGVDGTIDPQETGEYRDGLRVE
jgi:antitoxin component YwqK of YwqJK toxin-antitoxin module